MSNRPRISLVSTALPRGATVGLILAGIWLSLWTGRSPTAEVQVAALDQGARNWRRGPEAGLTLPAALTHDDPDHRIAACQRVASQQDPQWAALLMSRASDSDWRVRAAAFTALSRLGSFDGPVPPRDTPMARREELILEALAAMGDSAPSTCELYADARHVELASVMMTSCLTCHEGGPGDSESYHRAATVWRSCADCHRQIHDQYAASSHAQSLSHLRVPTVNPRTRQVELHTFGQRTGIACTVCHVPSEQVASGPFPTCQYSFVRPAEPWASCASCHAHTADQWRAWRTGPQFQPVPWPPSHVERVQAPDHRSCIDCHMTPSDTGPGVTFRAHRLTVRRDPALLRSGLHVQLLPAAGRGASRSARLVLTNLAGHDNPTGTRRRALRVHVTFNDVDTERRIVAELSPRTLGPVDAEAQPALAPGEQRTIVIEVPPGARAVRCDVTYVRNRFGQVAPEQEVATAMLLLPP